LSMSEHHMAFLRLTRSPDVDHVDFYWLTGSWGLTHIDLTFYWWGQGGQDNTEIQQVDLVLFPVSINFLFCASE
jgi:hypothetical protein